MPIKKEKVRHRRKPTSPDPTLMAILGCAAGIFNVVGVAMLAWYAFAMSAQDGLTEDHSKGWVGLFFIAVGLICLMIVRFIRAYFNKHHKRHKHGK